MPPAQTLPYIVPGMAKKLPLLAGFAKADITPREPKGMDLYGMPRPYPGARGILDRLHARACYLESGACKFLLIECDLVELPSRDYERIVESLARAGGLDKKNIWLCVTHCHSAPGGPAGGFQYKVLQRYLDRFASRVIAVGRRAMANRQRVKIGYGQGPIEGVGGNRRVKLSDGLVITGWADGPSPPPGVRIVDRGPVDRDVGVAVFKDRHDRPVGAIVNYSSHIHLYPILFFSAELAGAVAAAMERNWPGLVAVYTNGAEGNTSLCAHLPPQGTDCKAWNRQYRSGLKHLSAVVARKAAALYRRMEFESLVTMDLDETAMRIRSIPPRLPVKTVSALTINDLALVGEEDEAFVEYALAVKAGSPYRSTFVIGLKGPVNYYYFPTPARAEGGYETYLDLAPGSFERTTRAALSLLRSMRRERNRR